MNLKHLRTVLPEYPATPHLPFNANMGEGDVMASADDVSNLFQHELNITEKMDGSNCGMSFYDGNPVICNRTHILRKGYFKDTAAKQQFADVFNWFYRNKTMFEKLNDLAGPVSVYGEWMVAVHGMKYDALPSCFLAFDVYNYEAKKYLDPVLARKLLLEAGFNMVPLISHFKFESAAALEELTRWVSQYAPTQQLEGIYIKIGDGRWLTHRYKMIREGFVQGALWNKKKISRNTILK